jgi:hypothetical protein
VSEKKIQQKIEKKKLFANKDRRENFLLDLLNKKIMPNLTKGSKYRAITVVLILLFCRASWGVGGKPGFKNCFLQLTRPDCIRYQEL